MTLYDAITTTLASFREICEILKVPEPTPELREEMRQLIAEGHVVQEGAKRGAKYRRADGAPQTVDLPQKPVETLQKTPEPKAISPKTDAPQKATTSALYNAISSTFASFREICEILEVPEPTPELREEMRQLIAEGRVVQEGVKRGAKYRRTDGGAQKTEPQRPVTARPQPTNSEAPIPEAVDPDKTPIVEAPKVKATPTPTVATWEWVNPKKVQFVNGDANMEELHEWILTNWREIGTTPATIIEMGTKISRIQGCPTQEVLVICNALSDLAQLGKIHVRAVSAREGRIHHYGWWPENPDFAQ